MTTTLERLAAALPDAERRGDDVSVVDATHDSRQAGPGWLFCAIVGANVDGHEHASDAVDAGASALLVERWLDLDVPQCRVPDTRRATGPAAAVVHDHPSRRLQVVGITGTNGKTTTTYLLEAAFGAGGVGTGLIGTIETRIHGRAQPGVRTTPEGTDLQRLLARMYQRGVDAVGMEVSSHGLDLHRVDGIEFAVAVFTNLSQDHLDWHETMEQYFRAKARLFTPGLARHGIVCIDDDWGRRLVEEATVEVETYGTAVDAAHRITDVRADLSGTRCTLVGPDGTATTVSTRLLGAINIRNAVAAYLAAVATGIAPDAARAGVAACRGVPGRLERVPGPAGDITVLVDYAHTPEALAQVVEVGRDLVGDGRLHLVVGCGGDRDRDKRPLMGAVAARADRAVLTSDNPRSEDPADILAAVVAGARQARASGARADVVEEVDRRRAIHRAVTEAAEGDVVIVAGKGHETGQEFADHTIPFDDRAVAAEALQQRAAGPADVEGGAA